MAIINVQRMHDRFEPRAISRAAGPLAAGDFVEHNPGRLHAGRGEAECIILDRIDHRLRIVDVDAHGEIVEIDGQRISLSQNFGASAHLSPWQKSAVGIGRVERIEHRLIEVIGASVRRSVEGCDIHSPPRGRGRGEGGVEPAGENIEIGGVHLAVVVEIALRVGRIGPAVIARHAAKSAALTVLSPVISPS